ncbi:YitT family protein [Collinsella sp. BA40]|uniref:YitT family protein n=1 Tax=Collinsella sp. BA40 TaxID=2560852 RepID=UPI0011C80C8B|nr:YitT family protein [Collinsella sp. BA40]TXF38283.1 YitT family protein [Collinsella sp. BA40]
MPEDPQLVKLKHLGRYVVVRRAITLACVCASALLQTYVIQAFVNPASLLSGGFTGVALLLERVAHLMGASLPVSIGVLLLNIPVALFCWRSISKRFVLFSMVQVGLLSAFLKIFSFQPILGETFLNVIFGGVLNGIAIAIALKSGASTAGTDFIALYVSNKTGKTIWPYVFAGNCCILAIFGSIFGWEHAAYSIVFQFISTKAIDGFYHRYNRSTLLITTKKPQEVARAYTDTLHHGASIIDATGAFSGEPVGIIHTVLSTYEVGDAIRLIRFVDPRAVVNVLKTDDFVGNFHRAGIDEPLPTEVENGESPDSILELIARKQHDDHAGQ